MRTFTIKFVTGAISLLGLCPLIPSQTPQHQPPPAMMTKMVVRLMGPGIKQGSFPALPRTIYRAGPHYARMENPPDARQRMEKITIIAEPDAYSVNLIDKKGTHAIDQGGPNDLHLPVVLPFDPKHRLPELDRLEFGDELNFFEKAAARRIAGPIINGKPTDAYQLQTAHGSATLVVRSETHVPVKLSWQTPEGTYTYEYITYEDVPFNPESVFQSSGRHLQGDSARNSFRTRLSSLCLFIAVDGNAFGTSDRSRPKSLAHPKWPVLPRSLARPRWLGCSKHSRRPRSPAHPRLLDRH